MFVTAALYVLDLAGGWARLYTMYTNAYAAAIEARSARNENLLSVEQFLPTCSHVVGKERAWTRGLNFLNFEPHM